MKNTVFWVYMGKWIRWWWWFWWRVGNIFDELIEFYRKHGGDLLKIKEVYSEEYLIIYRFNAYTNLVLSIKKTLMSIQDISKALLKKDSLWYATSTLHQKNIK
jgi:hypothetical protein